MTDTAATPANPFADGPSASAPAAAAPAPAAGHGPLWVGFAVLGALALVAITLAMIGQQRIKALEQELVRRQQDSQGQAIEARALAQQAQDLARSAEGKVTLLEGRVAENALQRTGLFLANDGIDPIAGQRVVEAQAVRRINAIMMTCGHYDASGDFAFRVGMPGKSGVGGGILAIAPRRAAVAVWSPGLNTAGNSLVGALALESLARRTGWSVF